MLSKLLLLLTISLNTIGLSSGSTKLDQSIIQKEANTENFAVASVDLSLPEIIEPPKVNAFAPKAIAYANNYILIDPESATVFASKGMNEKVPIASTTKIMTAVIVLENYKLDDIVTISNEAAYQVGADAHFRVGEKITVLSLLKALLIKSANGAAYAIAEYMNTDTEKGITKFVDAMNAKASELGMANTRFKDPAGLDVIGYSSAYDLAIVTKFALKNEIFAEIVKTKESTVTDVTGTIWHQLENSNRLVGEWEYPGAIGVKTGYMPEAGHCLVGAATRNGHTLYAIVLKTNADTATASAEESRRLLDWGWQYIDWDTN